MQIFTQCGPVDVVRGSDCWSVTATSTGRELGVVAEGPGGVYIGHPGKLRDSRRFTTLDAAVKYVGQA